MYLVCISTPSPLPRSLVTIPLRCVALMVFPQVVFPIPTQPMIVSRILIGPNQKNSNVIGADLSHLTMFQLLPFVTHFLFNFQETKAETYKYLYRTSSNHFHWTNRTSNIMFNFRAFLYALRLYNFLWHLFNKQIVELLKQRV